MRLAALVALATAAALSASDPSSADRALWSAVRSGDAAGVRRTLGQGANPDAALASGWTPLMEATKAGRLDLAETLLAGGARPDARDRAAGTALDVAEREGRTALVALLRRHGARGSGKSMGDRVCVRPWNGGGYCGTVTAIDGPSYLIAVTAVVGCENGCAGDAVCSAGRPVGGTSAEAVRAGTSVGTKSWCLTHTGLE
jgi:ankyrin repeat protein